MSAKAVDQNSTPGRIKRTKDGRPIKKEQERAMERAPPAGLPSPQVLAVHQKWLARKSELEVAA